MINLTRTLVILYDLPDRVCNYAFKHYEIDTLNITKIRHSKISVIFDFIIDVSPLNVNGFQQFKAQNLSHSLFY